MGKRRNKFFRPPFQCLGVAHRFQCLEKQPLSQIEATPQMYDEGGAVKLVSFQKG